MSNEAINRATAHFGKLLEDMQARAERLKNEPDWLDFGSLDPIIIGILPGDGIGTSIAADAEWIMRQVLKDEVASGKIEMRNIEGLTIERRAEVLDQPALGDLDHPRRVDAGTEQDGGGDRLSILEQREQDVER